MSDFQVVGYQLRQGSEWDLGELVKFMHRTYQELYPNQDFSHLERTVEQYFSPKTPLWWVEPIGETSSPVGCLWLGNAIDQIDGDRMTHIFLLYVAPDHRRQGMGSALMAEAETWAKNRGDRKIGLQVFIANQPALNLYEKLGYQTQSVAMVKVLREQGTGNGEQGTENA